jgi:hypothetical protein
MKKIFSLLSFLIIGFASFSQSKGYLQYDSLYIQKSGGNSELILRNATKDSIGFLFNKGGGRTEFRRIKTLNDSMFVVGGDTIKTRRVPTGVDYIQNQYASKQTAKAWFDTVKTKTGLFDNATIQSTFRGGYGANGSRTLYALHDADSFAKMAMEVFTIESLKKYHPADVAPSNPASISGGSIKAQYEIILPKGTYNLFNDFDFPTGANYGALKIDGSVDSANITFYGNSGFKAVTGISTFYARNDFNPYGVHYGNINGMVNSYLSSFQVSKSSTSYVQWINHFAAAETRGTQGPIGTVVGLFIEPIYQARIGRSWGILQLGTNDYNSFNGKLLIGDTSILNADANKLYVNGSSKFAGNIVQTSGRSMFGGAVDDGVSPVQVNGKVSTTDLKVSNIINLAATTAPTSSSDSSGVAGDIKRDSSGNLYIRTATQWLKFTGVTF